MFTVDDAMLLVEKSKSDIQREYERCVKEVEFRASQGLRCGYENITQSKVLEDLQIGRFKVTRVEEGDRTCPCPQMHKNGPLYKIEW